MDLPHVETHRIARGRDDLALAPGETLLAGGTWLFSEPQPDVLGLVDLTGLDWPATEPAPDGGLRIAGTCTVAELRDALAGTGLAALVDAAAAAFVMSWKIQRCATVGGNIALALPAGAMISLTAGLGATAVVWTPDGGERREPVADLVHGVRATGLAAGEVIRAVDVPTGSLAAATSFRRASLATRGRSGAVVVGRSSPAGPVLTVTAGTTRPVVLDPSQGTWRDQLAEVDCWYDDPHGAPDWRRAMTARLAAAVDEDLAA